MTSGNPLIPGYEDLHEIGRGGFATVYRARQTAFAREVAVKVIDRPNPDQETLDQFRRECQAVGSLSWHPHVVSVFDAGETADGRPYLTMELLPGGSIDDALDRGPLPVERAIAFAHQIADAVASAHEIGVLHRDLKPANVLIDRRGAAELADFGIARMVGGAATTTVGSVSGTIAYMAPELLKGERATPASDVYGIGMTVAAMLLGHSPLGADGAETPWAAVQRVGQDRVPDLRPAGAPEALARLVEACTAKDPAHRPATAAQVQAALAALAGAPVDPRPEPDVTIDRRTARYPAEHTVFTGPPPFPPRPEPKRRRRWLVAAALFATLALVAVAATTAWLGRDNGGDGTSADAEAPTDAETDTTTPDALPLVAPGKLTMCTVLAYEPFAFRGDSGEVTGFDVDLLRSIATAADLELVVVDVGGSGILTETANGTCDVAGLALTINPERAESVDFTQPYFEADQSLLVRTTSGLTSVADLAGHADPVVGVVGGSTGEAYAMDSIDGVEVIAYPTVEAAFDALENEEVTGVVQDQPINAYRAERDSNVEVIETFPSDERYGYAVAKDNPRILAMLDDGLDGARADRTYDELYESYFGGPPDD